MLAGREVNVWHFDEVRLWEISAVEVLAEGAPGLLALVPLMGGGQSLDAIARAVETIEGATPGRDAEARSIERRVHEGV